jgi:hypothetical protein
VFHEQAASDVSREFSREGLRSMKSLLQLLAIPLSRVPLVKYWLYPARIVIRKKAVAEVGGIAGAWIPYRYGVLPDGSEISLASTVDVAQGQAHRAYISILRDGNFTYYYGFAPIRWIAPIRTKGSDFHPLDPVPAATPLIHPPARSWRERRVMWRDYLNFKYVPEGSIRLNFTGGAGRAKRGGGAGA